MGANDYTIEDLNHRMSVDVPRFGGLAWIPTNDKRLWMLAQVLDSDGQPIFDEPRRTPTGLWERPYKVEHVPLYPQFQRDPVWMLCMRDYYSKFEFQRMFGSLEHYPLGGAQWRPVWTRTQLEPLHVVNTPTLQDTQDVIAILRSAKEHRPGEFTYEYCRNEVKLRMKAKRDMMLRLRDRLAINGRVVHTGKRGGSYSMAGKPADPVPQQKVC